MTSELLIGGFLLAFSILLTMNAFQMKFFEVKFSEGFEELSAPVSLEPSMDLSMPELAPETQCGIGYEPCTEGQKCMNGYCKSTAKPALGKTELPVIP